MPIIKDQLVVEGKASRDAIICMYVKVRLKSGVRYELIISEVKVFWGLSESHVYQILKKDRDNSCVEALIGKCLIKTMIQTLKEYRKQDKHEI